MLPLSPKPLCTVRWRPEATALPGIRWTLSPACSRMSPLPALLAGASTVAPASITRSSPASGLSRTDRMTLPVLASTAPTYSVPSVSVTLTLLLALALSTPLPGLDESISSASAGAPMLPPMATRSMLMPVTLLPASALASSSEPLSAFSVTSSVLLRTLSTRMVPAVSIRYTVDSASALTLPMAPPNEVSMSKGLASVPMVPLSDSRSTLMATMSASASL